ncbi:MAG: tetratricopeptide repeat protein [Pseudomonadota bacterium]|nr:tetratricopeptide repeat protein [Pseudomonadota bacterium]
MAVATRTGGKAAAKAFEARLDRARNLQRAGDAVGAIAQFEAALKLAPGDPSALAALGELARDLNAPEQAAGFFRAALTADPASVRALHGMAHALRDLGRQEEAVGLLQSALPLQPAAAPLWTAMGVLMADVEDHDNAETFLSEALRLDPTDGAAAGNLAEVLFCAGRIDDARTAYARALKLRPGDAALRFNHALFALGTGDIATGWRDYEARLDRRYPRFVRRDTSFRRWNGQPIPKGRLLVLAEQGVGDELHFLHCVDDVASRVGELWWEVDPRLLDLCRASFPAVQFMPWQASARPGFHRSHAWTKDAPRFDAAIEAGSLQTLFRRDPASFPAAPLLDAETAHPAPDGPLRIGLSWTSIRRNRLRDRGYVALDDLGPLLSVPGIEWVNVQYGEVDADIAAAERRFGIRIHTEAGLDLKDDFSGTARLMGSLDLVIAPTNTARQLAASLGVPSLVFSRLPYEFALGQAVNPFFPWMEDVVRLPDRVWARAVETVAGKVRALAARQPAERSSATRRAIRSR